MASSSIRVAYSSSLFRLPPAPLSSPPLALHFTSISLPSSHSSSSIRSIRSLPKRGSSLVMGAPSSSFLDSFNAEEVTSLTVLRADSGEPVQFNDLWDQNDGGMFIFKGKQLIYARKDGGTGDHAPLEDILNLCCTTPAV